MRSFRHLPIRVKLMMVIFLTSAIALLLACVASVGYEFLSYHQAVVRDLRTQAEIIGGDDAELIMLLFDNREV